MKPAQTRQDPAIARGPLFLFGPLCEIKSATNFSDILPQTTLESERLRILFGEVPVFTDSLHAFVCFFAMVNRPACLGLVGMVMDTLRVLDKHKDHGPHFFRVQP